MMTEWDFIAAPATVEIDFAVNQAEIVVNMLQLLNTLEQNAGLSQWMEETYHALSPEEKHANKLASMAFDAINWSQNITTFPDVIADLEGRDAVELRAQTLQWLTETEGMPPLDTLLSDADVLVRVNYEHASQHGKQESFDEPFWRWAYDQLAEAGYFKQVVVQHLKMMWERFLREHWLRNEALLIESRNAFLQMQFGSFSDAFAAIEAVTGRNMRGAEKMEQHFANSARLIFMPVTHLGPYISWGRTYEGDDLVFFSARLPRNTRVESPALNRSELLVRLNALADDTRLRMLEMLVENEEICAQDFITRLELSQSSASRHLRQLTASGYLNERRRDVAKCYSLNRERIEDTMKALGRFLDKH